MHYWNGRPLTHMSTPHLINTVAWLWRVSMHKKLQLTPEKYAEEKNVIRNERVERYSEEFMQEFDPKAAAETISEMMKEIRRRERNTPKRKEEVRGF